MQNFVIAKVYWPLAVDGILIEVVSIHRGGLRSPANSTTLRPMQEPLRYRHRVVTEDDIVFIRKLIAEHPGTSRWALSKKLCEAWNWVQANGALRDMVCRGMMLMLHRQGLIELPSARPMHSAMGKRRRPLPSSVDDTPLRVSLAELGPLQVRQVRRTPEEALFNSLLQHHHYLVLSRKLSPHPSFTQFCDDGRAILLIGSPSEGMREGEPMRAHKYCGPPLAGRAVCWWRFRSERFVVCSPCLRLAQPDRSVLALAAPPTMDLRRVVVVRGGPQLLQNIHQLHGSVVRQLGQ